MSKGALIKPKNPNLPDNLSKKPLEEIIYYIAQTCEVNVDNSEWQNSDKSLEEKITNLKNKAKEIEKRQGTNHDNLSKQINTILNEIEDLKKESR